MGVQKQSGDWTGLLKDLEVLQMKWELKAKIVVQAAHRLRAHGIAFGIETGRRAFTEQQRISPDELNVLLDRWARVARSKANNKADAGAVKGIDFGIGLVMRRVRRYLDKVPRPKPPASAERGRAPAQFKRRPRAQS